MSFARFQEIVQRLVQAETWDAAALQPVRDELLELKELVAPVEKPELDALIDASVILVGLIPVVDPIEAEDCRKMVVRLVQIALRRLRAALNAKRKDLGRRKSGASGSGAKEHPPRPAMSIGEVLVQLGFVTMEDIERAKEQADRTGRMIGAVLVEMGLCEREDVARAVFLQRSLQPIEANEEETADEELPQEAERIELPEEEEEGENVRDFLLGEALLRRGWVSPEALLTALRYRERHHMRVGEALVALGYATVEQVEQALAWQTEVRSRTRGPAIERIRLVDDDQPAAPSEASAAAPAPPDRPRRARPAKKEQVRLDVDEPPAPLPPSNFPAPIPLEDEPRKR